MFFLNRTFGTEPLVLHGQGPDFVRPFWREICDRFFATPRRRLGRSAEVTILTWNSRDDGTTVLERSLAHLGIPAVVKGRGIDGWVNSRDKPRCTLEALEEIDTPYVLGIDAYDAIVVGDPALLVRRLETGFEADLVFNAEKVNFPTLSRFREFEESLPGAGGGDFRYLNGGAWIGRTEFCRRFFADACRTAPVEVRPESEQGVLKQLFQVHHPRVGLDYSCRMFQTLGYVFHRDFELQDEGGDDAP